MGKYNFLQSYDTRNTQLLATHDDCSKQYNLRQYSLTWVQKGTQAPSETDYTRTFGSGFTRAKAKRNKTFRCHAEQMVST